MSTTALKYMNVINAEKNGFNKFKKEIRYEKNNKVSN